MFFLFYCSALQKKNIQTTLTFLHFLLLSQVSVCSIEILCHRPTQNSITDPWFSPLCIYNQIFCFVSTNFAHLETEIFTHSLKKSRAPAQSDWIESMCEQLFSSLWFSVVFRFRFWLGHCNTWICFDLSHPIVALALCLEFSCRKLNLDLLTALWVQATAVLCGE